MSDEFHAGMYLYTTGGADVAVRRLPLTDAVLAQTDRTLNARLWRDFRVELSEAQIEHTSQKFTSATVAAKRQYYRGLGTLGRCVELYDEEWINATAHMIVIINDLLLEKYEDEFPDVQEEMRKRKKAGHVLPLAQAVSEATDCKEQGNELLKADKIDHALSKYITGLSRLYPWAGVATFFDAETAFSSGLAGIENALWSNITAAIIALLQSRRLPDEESNAWAVICQTATSLVLGRRYTSYDTLRKMYQRCVKLQVMADPRLDDDDDHDKGLRADMWAESAKAITKTMSLAKNRSQPWAHWNCTSSHVCILDSAPNFGK